MRAALSKTVFVLLLCACLAERANWNGVEQPINPAIRAELSIELPKVYRAGMFFDLALAKGSLRNKMYSRSDRAYDDLLKLLVKKNLIDQVSRFKGVSNLEYQVRLDLVAQLAAAIKKLQEMAEKSDQNDKLFGSMLQELENARTTVAQHLQVELNLLPFKEAHYYIFSDLVRPIGSRRTMEYTASDRAFNDLLNLLAKHNLIDQARFKGVSGLEDRLRLERFDELAAAITKLGDLIKNKLDLSRTPNILLTVQYFLQKARKTVELRIQGGRALKMIKSLQF